MGRVTIMQKTLKMKRGKKIVSLSLLILGSFDILHFSSWFQIQIVPSLFFSIKTQGWRMVERLGVLWHSRGLQIPVSKWRLTITPNCSPSGFPTFFWTLRTTPTHGTRIHLQENNHAHEILKSNLQSIYTQLSKYLYMYIIYILYIKKYYIS